MCATMEPNSTQEGAAAGNGSSEEQKMGPKEIDGSRNELLWRVQNLKKDLQDWREKLDSQVQNYRKELGDLRSSLNTEVEQLKNEFQDLRNSLKTQLDSTTKADSGADKASVENGESQ